MCNALFRSIIVYSITCIVSLGINVFVFFFLPLPALNPWYCGAMLDKRYVSIHASSFSLEESKSPFGAMCPRSTPEYL